MLQIYPVTLEAFRAHALGYVGALDPALVAKLNRIIGTLVRLVGR